MRIKIIRLIIILFFLCLLGDLIYMQVIRGHDYYILSKNNSIRVVPLEGRRGLILDRNGEVIAGSRLSFDVLVVPQEIENRGNLFSFLGSVLNIDQEKLFKRYKSKMVAPFAPVVVAADVSKDMAIVLEENKFRFPGLLVHATFERHYPFAEVNAHLLGYVGKISRSRITRLKDYGYTLQSIVGYSGIEEYYDDYLRGEDGGLQVEVNNQGKQIRLLGAKESVNGQDVTLTIDNRIQKMAMESLEGRKGAVVVMDLDNGEILGMVSSPSYDPNFFVTGSPEISTYFNSLDAPLLNRVISGQFPPGSTFKLPVATGALETKKITPATSFNCPGYYMLGRRQFKCSHVHGTQGLIQGIGHSCNVYFFNTGLALGPELIVKYARLLGLGSLTNIDLPYEAKGLIPDKPLRNELRNQKWHPGDILNVSIGQGDILVTPLQLVRMMAIIARNGEDITPHIIKSIESYEVSVPLSHKRIEVSQKTFDNIQAGLRSAVAEEGGTARLLDIPDLPISGKTGTAQTSGGKAHHAWFVGYCATSKTKIIFCVFLEHGGSSYNACFVAKNLLMRMKEEEIL